jgi:hypothetical protein
MEYQFKKYVVIQLPFACFIPGKDERQNLIGMEAREAMGSNVLNQRCNRDVK